MARKRIDLVGQRFGSLKVLSYSHTELNKAVWLCRCDCGRLLKVKGQGLKARLKTGKPQGCGCHKKKYPKMNREDFKLYSRWVSERRWRYNLDEVSLRDMMDEQKGCCSICGSSLINPKYDGRELNVDHDHRTGEVRGLLCFRCNSALGFALDDTTILDNLKRYIHAN